MMSGDVQPDPTETHQDARSGPQEADGVPTGAEAASGPQDAPAAPQEPSWPEAGSDAWYERSIDPLTARLAYVVVGLWDGKHPLYQCRHCPWNTTEEEEARKHYIDNHTGEPGPPPARSGLVRASGQPL